MTLVNRSHLTAIIVWFLALPVHADHRARCNLVRSGDPDYPVEIEIYAGNAGIIRTEFGWYEISEFSWSEHTLTFLIEVSRISSSSART